MTSWYKNKRATTVLPDGDGYFTCIYHQTKVVRWNTDEIVLNSGGYQTATTKTRMNQVAQEYNLNFSVFQKDCVWYVKQPDGSTVKFKDRMKLVREVALS